MNKTTLTLLEEAHAIYEQTMIDQNKLDEIVYYRLYLGKRTWKSRSAINKPTKSYKLWSVRTKSKKMLMPCSETWNDRCMANLQRERSVLRSRWRFSLVLQKRKRRKFLWKYKIMQREFNLTDLSMLDLDIIYKLSMWWNPSLSLTPSFLEVVPALRMAALENYPVEVDKLRILANIAVDEGNLYASLGALMLW